MAETFTFCPRCGNTLRAVEQSGRRRMSCDACGFVQYRNPSPAAAVLMLDEQGRVLLVRRRDDPFKGLWTMPAGFIEYGEDIRDTAVRELEEETGLVAVIEAIHAVESCADDPRGESLLVVFRGRRTGGELAAGDDAAEAAFFPLGELPPIAFDCQRRVLRRLAGRR